MYLSGYPGNLTQFRSRFFTLRNAEGQSSPACCTSNILQIHFVSIEIGVIW